MRGRRGASEITRKGTRNDDVEVFRKRGTPRMNGETYRWIALTRLCISCLSVHCSFLGLTTPTLLTGTVLFFLVIGFFVVGDEHAFRLGGMSSGALCPWRCVCVWVWEGEGSVRRVEFRGGHGQRLACQPQAPSGQGMSSFPSCTCHVVCCKNSGLPWADTKVLQKRARGGTLV